MSTPLTRRTRALSAYRDMIASTWGPTTEGGDGTLRAVHRRQWMPAKKIVQACTVVDDGKRRLANEGDDRTENFTVGIKLVFDLPGEWTRQGKADDIVDFVELVSKRLCGYLPADCAALGMKYVDDDPVEAILGNGQTMQLWIVTFEFTYFDLVTDGNNTRPEDT